MATLGDEERKFLLNLAAEARRRAYAPYSNYPVGAALRTKSGRVFTGANVENAAYPNTMCAERIAVFKAVTEGEREFDALAVVTANGGHPCGGCRQVLAEFGSDTIVLIGSLGGDPATGSPSGDSTGASLVEETTIAKLLPGPFTPADLLK